MDFSVPGKVILGRDRRRSHIHFSEKEELYHPAATGKGGKCLKGSKWFWGLWGGPLRISLWTPGNLCPQGFSTPIFITEKYYGHSDSLNGGSKTPTNPRFQQITTAGTTENTFFSCGTIHILAKSPQICEVLGRRQVKITTVVVSRSTNWGAFDGRWGCASDLAIDGTRSHAKIRPKQRTRHSGVSTSGRLELRVSQYRAVSI